MMPKLFESLILLLAIPVAAQTVATSIVLTDTSTVPPQEISKRLQKECPNVSILPNATKTDYTLDAVERTVREGIRIVPEHVFDLTLFDHDGRTFSNISSTSLGNAAKEICHAIKTTVLIEVVDTQTLTQSLDARGDTSGGAVGTVVNGLTGRRTHTDTSSIYVIVNGEHALLDCYERRTGCATIGPGQYYGQHDGDGIWLSYQMPITHKQLRNHYKIVGSW